MNINFAYILFIGWFYSVTGEPDRSELKIKLNRLKVPREGFSHPWQLGPPAVNRIGLNDVLYWQENPEDFDEIRRLKMQRIHDQLYSMSNDQSASESSSFTATASPIKPQTNHADYSSMTTLSPVRLSTIGTAENNGAIHRFKKIHSLGMSDSKTQLMNKYWSAVYNPLPFGGPRSPGQIAEEVETNFRLKQLSGLPVARTSAREKERETVDLKLPIPDSEIASPGHYRQPFSLDHLRDPKRKKMLDAKTSKNYPPNGTVNVEAFRILMEVIRSLRDLGINTTQSPNLKQ